MKIKTERYSKNNRVPFFVYGEIVIPLFPLKRNEHTNETDTIQMPLPPSYIVGSCSFPAICPYR
ncbi:hypothetical protein M124_0894 [Bacteroides fragilis str. 3988T(B)14]|uniref:Uncharacterized protein n=1 Tax=Bacteroides fragilis str. 3988T(B)14 TaxID=1339315 RepID=A0A015SYK4_BACFG|nr:hypothetical protein M124_0894 [Bacteroides fragilis str. 3988T(B)14]